MQNRTGLNSSSKLNNFQWITIDFAKIIVREIYEGENTIQFKDLEIWKFDR